MNIIQLFNTIFAVTVLFSKTNARTNPDVSASTLEIIARHGYPAEGHTISTDDGYLLTLHRIPYSKYNRNTTNRQPVFLQHGLTGCSSDWILNKNKSLAFQLSDAGYDVWLGNARGNMYSRAHIYYTPSEEKYWDFSWHEMGKYDLPASFNHIVNTTNKSGEIIYIGHSMGTTMFFVYSSLYKNSTETVKMMVALAPVSFMSDVRSPIRYLAPFANDIEWIAQHLGLNEFAPSNKVLEYLAEVGCDHATREMKLCRNIIFLLVGFDKEEFDPDLLPLVLTHSPSGTSTKAVVHYAQEISSGGNFQEFDYGKDDNLARYGTEKPPQYNVSEINVPIYLMSAVNDWLAGTKDVFKFSHLLKSKVGNYVVPQKLFNHIDFLWAKDVIPLVYKPLMDMIKKYS